MENTGNERPDERFPSHLQQAQRLYSFVRTIQRDAAAAAVFPTDFLPAKMET